jgi:DNA-directed RNA polymerase subunit RPC12/RpoP
MTLTQSIVDPIKCPYCGIEIYSSVRHFDKMDTPSRTHFLCECRNNHIFTYNITFGNGLFITGATLLPNTEQKKLIYHEYIQSEEWKVKSRNEKIKAGYRCMLCGKSGDDHSLNTHHNTYANLGDEQPGELIVLCDSCHKKFHGKDE